MKTRKFKIYSSFFVITAIAALTVFTASSLNANTSFGKTLTKTQMANMFGGGFVMCGDTDCDTQSGSCPGDDTCYTSADLTNCYKCKSGNGQTCGQPGGAGWQCQSSSEDCKDGSLGSCSGGVCGPYTEGPDNGDSCGTRPDC